MLPISDLTKDLNTFTQTMGIIQKIDNKLGKSLALDRASFKFQQIKSKMADTLANITNGLQNKKSKPKLSSLYSSCYSFNQRAKQEQQDFLTDYLHTQKKRDQRFQRYQKPQSKLTKQPQFRRSKKPSKSKTKHLYTFYRSPNNKYQHNKEPSQQMSEQYYKQGVYTLSSNFRKEDINMNFMEDVLPKPAKNPIARRNLDSIFVVSNQNPLATYEDFSPLKSDTKQNQNIFLTRVTEKNISNNKIIQNNQKKRLQSDISTQKSKFIQGPSLDILDFKLVQNHSLKLFKCQNGYIWSSLFHLITNIEYLLKHCGISSARIKTKQLLRLQSICKKVPDKMLIKCLSNSQQVQKIMSKQQRNLSVKNPEIAAKFIQCYWRYHFLSKKPNTVF